MVSVGSMITIFAPPILTMIYVFWYFFRNDDIEKFKEGSEKREEH